MVKEEEVLNIARLAKLKLSNDQVINLAREFESIIDKFKDLQSVNTDQVEPMLTPMEVTMNFRKDIVEKTMETEETLKNAPDRIGNLFKVPPVV